MTDAILKQDLPLAWENFKDMALTIWNSNSTFLIGFALFFLIGTFLVKKVEKRHHHR